MSKYFFYITLVFSLSHLLLLGASKENQLDPSIEQQTYTVSQNAREFSENIIQENIIQEEQDINTQLKQEHELIIQQNIENKFKTLIFGKIKQKASLIVMNPVIKSPLLDVCNLDLVELFKDVVNEESVDFPTLMHEILELSLSQMCTFLKRYMLFEEIHGHPFCDNNNVKFLKH